MNPETLDGIWISHFHADHGFGVPPLLVRFWEEARTRDLHFFGQQGIESFVRQCLELAYPNFYQRLTFRLDFTEVEPGKPVTAFGLSWRSAVNGHPQRDLALRLEAKGKSIFYSGDGHPTPESRALAQGVDLIVHEAFGISKEVKGHGSVAGCLDMAIASQARKLALVHIQRQVRRERLDEIKELATSAGYLEVIIPRPGDHLTI